MVKKSGIVLVVLLYLITATGFAVNLHFCGESIESININETAKTCGMDSKCCKDTHLEVKVKDAHQTAHTVFSSINLALPVVVFQGDFYREPLAANHFNSFSTPREPPPGHISIYLKYQNFRI